MKLSYNIAFILLPYFLCAQDEPGKLIITEAGFTIGMPLGVYADNNSNNGYGGDLNVYFQLSPYHSYLIGTHIGYQYNGSNSVTFFEQIDGIDTELRESATSHMVTLLGGVRYYPDFTIANIKLYGDLLFGPKILFTTLTLRDTDGGDLINEFEIEESDLSLSYGGSIGLQLSLGSFTSLNLRANYLPGVSARFYAKKNEIPESDFAIDGFDLKNSATNIMQFTLGVSFFL